MVKLKNANIENKAEVCFVYFVQTISNKMHHKKILKFYKLKNLENAFFVSTHGFKREQLYILKFHFCISLNFLNSISKKIFFKIQPN